MFKKFKKMLFSEMRMFVTGEEKSEITDESLVKAITLNENVKSLGYSFKPQDIIKLAKTNIDNAYDEIKSYIGDVKAAPMYPDFPSQVMDMPEAVFRFHQIVHYFSTYGIEFLTGEKVSKGWLPEIPETKKTIEDIALIEAKVLEVVSEKDQFSIPYQRILSKNERMTIPETEIIKECVKHNIDPDVKITFKENLSPVFNVIMDTDLPRSSKVRILSTVCQHTGDVWKCLESYLGIHKWHLKTSEKRTIVELLESYPINDFKANLIITNKKANRVITILEFLSYNRFSKKKGYQKAVADLRNGDLRSWQGKMHNFIKEHSPDTVSFIGNRPGMLLRSINWLLNEGFQEKEITTELMAHASDLSMQTLVNVITRFSNEETDYKNAEAIVRISKKVLYKKMQAMEVPFRRKRVYIDWQDVVPERSVISKSDEGGYVRSGMAIKLPEMGRFVRFFCYWNDASERIDIDLHAYAETVYGEPIHVGWNGGYTDSGITFSGDITHCDAAEYIDVDMDSNVSYVDFKIHSYTGVPFKNIDTCFTGLMAVSKLGQDVKTKLYNPKNVIWSHELNGNVNSVNYGTLDVQNKVLILNAGQGIKSRFTFKEYFDMYFAATHARVVEDPEKAEIVLKPYKAESEKEFSFLDENFFF